MDFDITGNVFGMLGGATDLVKKKLKQLEISPYIINKVTRSMYEAEINASIHGGGGSANIELTPQKVIIKINDKGPGIPSLDLAMKDGYSTVSDSLKRIGFGAGMGLANIKKSVDKFQITSKIKSGTEITMEINLV